MIAATAAAATPVTVSDGSRVQNTRLSPITKVGVAAKVSGGRGVRHTVVAMAKGGKGARGDADVGASSFSFSDDDHDKVTTRRAMLVDAAAMLASCAVFPAFADETTNEAVDAAPAPRPPPPPPPAPKKAIPLASVSQPVMAYEFSYPTETTEAAAIKWVPSRVRDTYSSAEPMSPDARQRIVYELISFKGPMTCTVTVGPTPPKLVGKDPKEWKPKQVADAVLSDRATGRIATGQKVSLAEVESAKKVEIDGNDYVYYEFISQGSPNLAERDATTFRHSLGVTARRGDYLYTYTISAPETLWDVNADGFAQGVKSFRLSKPNRKKFREPGNEGLLPPLPF